MFQKLNVLDRLMDAFRPLRMNSLVYWMLANMLMFDSKLKCAGSRTMFPTTS